jgi:hypothetical protein
MDIQTSNGKNAIQREKDATRPETMKDHPAEENKENKMMDHLTTRKKEMMTSILEQSRNQRQNSEKAKTKNPINELVSQHNSTTVVFTFDDLRTDSQKHAHSIGLLPYWWYDKSAMTQFNPPQTTSGQTT